MYKLNIFLSNVIYTSLNEKSRKSSFPLTSFILWNLYTKLYTIPFEIFSLDLLLINDSIKFYGEKKFK